MGRGRVSEEGDVGLGGRVWGRISVSAPSPELAAGQSRSSRGLGRGRSSAKPGPGSRHPALPCLAPSPRRRTRPDPAGSLALPGLPEPCWGAPWGGRPGGNCTPRAACSLGAAPEPGLGWLCRTSRSRSTSRGRRPPRAACPACPAWCAPSWGWYSQMPSQPVLVYEVGFLVCTAIGLLFIIFMPLVGFCFCCCRCCGNCGGTMYQKQSKRTGCRRRALFASVLLVTTLILAGNVCAFISNNRVSRAVNGSFGALNTTLDNLGTFVRSIPQQVDFIIASSDVPVSRANSSLQSESGHGGLWGAGPPCCPPPPVTDLVDRELRAVNASGQSLQQLQGELSQNLSRLQEQINRTLQSCGQPCARVSVSGLAPEADFSMVPDVISQLELLSNLTSANLSAALQQANETLNKTPTRVEEQAQKVVADARSQLAEVRRKIGGVRSEIPVLDTLGNVTAALDTIGRRARDYEPQVTTYDGYRWIVGICLCCLVLLIVLCYLLALALGALGLKPSALPTERGCLANSGGDFFMAGVGFSFLFSWLLMLLVLVTFLLGGNAYTLVCRPWHSGQLLTFLETSDLTASFNLSKMLGLQGGTVTLSGVYNNCQHNEPLWSTLHLGQAVPLDELLNISQYTSEITAAFDRLNVSLDPVTFLSPSQKQLLRDVGASGLQPNFTGALQQLERNVTQRDLLALAEQLDALANGSDNPTTRQELRQEASDLRQINGQIRSRFPPEMVQINDTLQRIEDAQTFLDTRAAEIVSNESRAFLNTLLGYFRSYVDWAKRTLTGEVGLCEPAAKTVDVAATVACSYVVDSLNGFWFSLGWCAMFLLPGVILAVRLAKFYRRMKIADVYESDGETLEMSSSATLFKIPRVKTRK
ncbi:fibroblast growth factor-binding protein 3 [Platysternon megacephalum]|uniref:Fibroblast growth factor-binding protein 3 n=1 Tax=Platysternon megacephalum TaxID=55544 RepID=A0A4D9EEQ6_9SAUR|nr:fibroblast growth factor-binding protein 3 [Platysternon megacephalum]